MSENRINVVSPAAGQPSMQPTVSPTGAPVIHPNVALVLTVLVAIAGVLPLVPGIPPFVLAICGVVVAIGSALGIASPGIRKKE